MTEQVSTSRKTRMRNILILTGLSITLLFPGVGFGQRATQADITTVDTVADLANLNNVRDGSTLRTRGYNTVGDGGANDYYYDSDSSATIDAGFVLDGPGSVGRYLAVDKDKVTTSQFGMVGDGVTNETTLMKAFFDACIANGTEGRIKAGEYVITQGQLNFDTPFVDAAWPNIRTDGYEYVVFKAAAATDAAFITITNGTATSAAGKYWRGGSIGGITFDQNAQTKASAQHGISIRGMWGTEFGYMVGDGLGGSTIYLPETLYTGNNPDPYAITFCTFKGAEANLGDRYAFENQNWVGLNNCRIDYLRAITCDLGTFYGAGAANIIGTISTAACNGWVIDDGTATANTGGSPSRLTVIDGELDGPAGGFRLNKLTNSTFLNIRFVHRDEASAGPLNSGEGYWPNVAVDIGGGTSPAINNIKMNLIHRVEAGGLIGELGEFIDANSAGGNIVNVEIDNEVLDNAAFGLDQTDLITGFDNNVIARIRGQQGKIAFYNYPKMGGIFRANTGVNIGTAGYGSLTSKIIYATTVDDPYDAYDNVNGWWTVPQEGNYLVTARITTTPNSSTTLVRFGIASAISGVFSATEAHQRYDIPASSNQQTFEITAILPLQENDQIFPMCAQNGGTTTTEADISAAANLTWSIYKVD